MGLRPVATGPATKSDGVRRVHDFPARTMSSFPPIIYGCAWKGSRTSALVQEALDAGFRAIDTAAQPKHYDEASAGEGVSAWLAARAVPRSALWLQTKFTPLAGQDASKPLAGTRIMGSPG